MLRESSRRFQNKLTVNSLKLVQFSLWIFPRPVVQFFTERLFSIACLFTRRLNNTCRKNLESVYKNTKTEQEYDQLRKRCLKNIGLTMMDMLYFVDRPEELEKSVVIKNEHILKAALENKKGVVGVTAHLGNFPLLFLILVRRGYKVNVIIRKMRDNGFSDFMHELCAKWNINMISLASKREFIKESLKVLQNNELLFILLDEVVPREEGVLVDFFGQKVTRAVGPLLFHNRMGSPIVPIFIVRNTKTSFEVHIEPELKVEKKNKQQDENVVNISKLTKIIELFVCKYPLQWGGWLNKRWMESVG
ncbi:MAG: lysophospholipid acyltransferase family protein [Candidatus Omnitrophica bacterium]|nr:lysophospholipid acyltransferase family protein [Candidatus Omnitrophota bacterium]